MKVEEKQSLVRKTVRRLDSCDGSWGSLTADASVHM